MFSNFQNLMKPLPFTTCISRIFISVTLGQVKLVTSGGRPFSGDGIFGFGLGFAKFLMLVLGFGFVQALLSNRQRRQSDTSPAPRCLFFTRAGTNYKARASSPVTKAEKNGKKHSKLYLCVVMPTYKLCFPTPMHCMF